MKASKFKSKTKPFLLNMLLLTAMLTVFCHISPVEVHAESSTPFTIIKNPQINNPAYWSAEKFGYDHPDTLESYSVVNSSGWFGHCAITTNNPADIRFWKPWMCAPAVQGLLFQSGVFGEAKEKSGYNFPYTQSRNINYQYFSEVGFDLPVLGQGLQHYIYIPADVPDGVIIANITVTRMHEPERLPGQFFPLSTRLYAETAVGLGLWFAAKVQFWDVPGVPAHLRGKTAYLGWMSTDMFGCPNLLVGEIWCDLRLYEKVGGYYFPVSRELGNSWGYPSVDLSGMLGSIWDWDWHVSPVYNTTDQVGVAETFTFDLGKYVKEFVAWSNNPMKRNEPTIGRMNMGSDFHPQLYSFVGFTLIAVGPTMEVVDTRATNKVTWLQIYDYRSNNGQPVTDPDFWQFIKVWKWAAEHGFPDPYAEHWFNIVLPETLQNSYEFSSLVHGQELSVITNAAAFSDGYTTGINRLVDGVSFDSTASGVWAQSGVLHSVELCPMEIPSEFVQTVPAAEFNKLQPLTFFKLPKSYVSSDSGSELWKPIWTAVIWNRLAYGSGGYALIRFQTSTAADSPYLEVSLEADGDVHVWHNNVYIMSTKWSRNEPLVLVLLRSYTNNLAGFRDAKLYNFWQYSTFWISYWDQFTVKNTTYIAVHGANVMAGSVTIGFGEPTLTSLEHVSFTVSTVTRYKYNPNVYVPNNGHFAVDYSVYSGNKLTESGEIVLYDHPSSTPTFIGWSEIQFNNATVKLLLSYPPVPVTIKFYVHCEAWNAMFRVAGVTSIYIEWQMFNRLPFKITVKAYPESLGVTSPISGSVVIAYFGDSVRLRAKANSGFYFWGWRIVNDLFGVDKNVGCGSLIDEWWTLDLTADNDYNVTALFGSSSGPALITLNIKHYNYYSYTDEKSYGYKIAQYKGWSIPSFGAYAYEYGSQVTLKAAPYSYFNRKITLGYTLFNQLTPVSYYQTDVVYTKWTVKLVNQLQYNTSVSEAYALVRLQPYQDPSPFIELTFERGGVLKVWVSYNGQSKSQVASGTWSSSSAVYVSVSEGKLNVGYENDRGAILNNYQLSTSINLYYVGAHGAPSSCTGGWVDVWFDEKTYWFEKWVGVKRGGDQVNFYQNQINVVVNETWKEFRAVFASCKVYLNVRESGTGALITDFSLYIRDCDEYKSVTYHPTGFYVYVPLGTWTLKISKTGYYDEQVILNAYYTSTSISVNLRKAEYSGGGGGGGRPPLLTSKFFVFNFKVYNASLWTYQTFNGLVKVTPFRQDEFVQLVILVHYYTEYPIIEIEAVNIAEVWLNVSGIYKCLNCPFFKNAKGFVGFKILTDSPLVVAAVNMPFKPVEIWKLKPGEDPPGMKVTNWSWTNENRAVTFSLTPEDPTFSMLSSPISASIDTTLQMISILLTVMFLAVTVKLVKSRLEP